MRLALVTLAALRCRAAAPQSRWRPYLDAGTPIKPSQCVLSLCPGVRRRRERAAVRRCHANGGATARSSSSRTHVPAPPGSRERGSASPRGKPKAPYHQATMADCCLLELEDPDWLDPQHPMYDFMLEQGGRCRRPVRATRASSRRPAATRWSRLADPGRRAGLGVRRPVSRFEGDWEAGWPEIRGGRHIKGDPHAQARGRRRAGSTCVHAHVRDQIYTNAVVVFVTAAHAEYCHWGTGRPAIYTCVVNDLMSIMPLATRMLRYASELHRVKLRHM